jgi:acid stress chaperone HdeB
MLMCFRKSRFKKSGLSRKWSVSPRRLVALALATICPSSSQERLLVCVDRLRYGHQNFSRLGSTPLKSMYVLLAAIGFTLATAPAQAVVLDLSTVTCKQFIAGDKDEISMVLTWLDGWYKGDEDEAIIDTDVFVANAKNFGSFCAANPNISVVNAAEKILGK